MLRQPATAEGVKPWGRGVYGMAHRHLNGALYTSVSTAALELDRLRREFPGARNVEMNLCAGLKLCYAPSTEAIEALSKLSAQLKKTLEADFEESCASDFECTVRRDGYLTDPAPHLRRTKASRQHAVLAGFEATTWAAWRDYAKVDEATDKIPLPDLRTVTELAGPRVMPRRGEYVRFYLRDVSHRAWTVVVMEWVQKLPRPGSSSNGASTRSCVPSCLCCRHLSICSWTICSIGRPTMRRWRFAAASKRRRRALDAP